MGVGELDIRLLYTILGIRGGGSAAVGRHCNRVDADQEN